MSLRLFTRECPGLLFSLGRFLDEPALQVLTDDYDRVVAAGGNDEEGITREEGVSFNRRVARILSLVVKEGGCRAPSDLRIAMYASTTHECVPPDDECLAAEVRRARAASTVERLEGIAAVVAASIMLDTVRHMHMTSFTTEERARRLGSLNVDAVLSSVPQQLRDKLTHSISMQQRGLGAESSQEDVL